MFRSSACIGRLAACIRTDVELTVRLIVNTFIARYVRVQSVLVKKTIYGRCPKCKAKSDLVVISGDPGREKFKCNQCYHVFGMDEL